MRTIARRVALQLASLVGVLLGASSAPAALVQWEIDSTQSFLRLNIPDQAIQLGSTTATLRLRDATTSASWSDAGGRRAFLEGIIATDYSVLGGGTIEFLPGSSVINALEQHNLRPNPAAFNPAASTTTSPDGTYTDATAAPAAYGARARSTVTLLTDDAAYLAFRDVAFGLASGVVALGPGGTIAPNATQMGIASGSLDVDGLPLPIIGQAVPDIRDLAFSVPSATNTAGGTITPSGLLHYLTLAVSFPFVVDLDGALLNGSVTGQIVAVTLVPEPGSFVLLGIGVSALTTVSYRCRKRSGRLVSARH